MEMKETFYEQLGITSISIGSAIDVINLNKKTNACVCLNGESGIGKTHIVRQIAAARKPTKPFRWRDKVYNKSVPLITLFLAHMQPEDVGVPFPARAARTQLLQEADLLLRLLERETEAGRAKALREKLDKATNRIIANGFSEHDHFDFLLSRTFADMPQEGILFLDEWNRAEKATIKAFFTLIEDRQIHGKHLPEGIQIVTAMNPSNGSYMVNEAEKDHAIRKRLTFVAVTTNLSAWLTYAKGPGNFNPLVTDFIKAMPTFLYDTKVRDAGKIFPCPATWEKVSEVLKAAKEAGVAFTDLAVETSIGGHVGVAAASKFLDYIRDHNIVIEPFAILHEYGERSKTRRRVKKLVEDNRNDILDELCTGVAATLFSDQEDPEEIADGLALFMGDLQTEMAVSFVTNKLSSSSKDVTNGNEYLGGLSKALHTRPPYRKLFKNIAAAMKKANEQMEE